MTALVCVLMGCGIPTTANYIIMVTVAAPTLAARRAPLVAHFFVFYYGVLADITPPVALAAYAAAGMAGSDPFKTGNTAFRLGLGKALVPFVFVFAPSLLLVAPGFSGPNSSTHLSVASSASRSSPRRCRNICWCACGRGNARLRRGGGADGRAEPHGDAHRRRDGRAGAGAADQRGAPQAPRRRIVGQRCAADGYGVRRGFCCSIADRDDDAAQTRVRHRARITELNSSLPSGPDH